MKKIKFLLFLFIILFHSSTRAQKISYFKIKPPNYTNHKLDEIVLPFWDDFSSSKKLDDKFWSSSENVSIKDFDNINAPSKNIVLFDGIDKNGLPYDNSGGYGTSDVLISDVINMKNLLSADSVFLSFFWRFNINGEYPDYEDTIFVDFLNDKNLWETVWYKNGGSLNKKNKFKFEGIYLNQKFLHESFQFKIYNKGNSMGPFDSWLIDYVYVDKDRTRNDSTFIDRTIVHEGNKIFKDLISVPLDHLSYSENYSDTITIKIKNLDKNIHPLNYSVEADLPSENLQFKYYDKEPLKPILNGLEEREIKINPINLSEFKSKSDSLIINFLFYIDSGDSTLFNKDLLVNDSSRFSFMFSDFYSYDDGEAEYAAGLNLKNSELVLQYETFTQDTLTDIQIYFPENIYSTYTNQVEIMIYENLKNDGKILSSQFIEPEFNGRFSEYKLSKPIIVSDTFYIGFRQLENSFLPIGLDKNNNTSDKIFYKIDNSWISNDIVRGSIMIRPVFGKSNYVLTKINSLEQEKTVKVFPNPSSGIYNLSKFIQKARLYDINGKFLKSFRDIKEIDIRNLKNGVYILIIEDKNMFQKIKLVKTETI